MLASIGGYLIQRDLPWPGALVLIGVLYILLQLWRFRPSLRFIATNNTVTPERAAAHNPALPTGDVLIMNLDGRRVEPKVATESLNRYGPMRLFENPSTAHRCPVRCALQEGFPAFFEHKRRRAAGRVVEFPLTASPHRTAMALVSPHDITQRQCAEALLREREARYRAVFEHGGMGMAVFDRDERLVECNPALTSLWGGALATGALLGDLIPDAPSVATLRIGEPYSGRHRFLTKPGRERWVDLTLTAVRGGPEFVVAMLTDVSAAQETARAHERRVRELVQDNARKARFIAAVDHDIRQPLQAASILVHLLGNQPLDEPSRAIVDRLTKAMEHLGDMVSSVMDIARLGSGRGTPDIAPFPLDGVLDAIDADHRGTAEAKSIALHVDACSSLWVRTDRPLLTRILGNLLSNAVRYTDKGEVRVSARREHAEVVVEIADTGIGIPEAERERIFAEFHQTSHSKAYCDEGMGLGLAIVDQLARLLTLRIDVESQVGTGSIFKVWIPFAEGISTQLHEWEGCAPTQTDRLCIGEGAAIRQGVSAR